MLFDPPPTAPGPTRAKIRAALRMDETECVNARIAEAAVTEAERRRIEETARGLVETIRKGRRNPGGIDAFMQEYELSTEEGVLLMCLAEALLRIPDAATADRLIRDKIGGKNWESHLGNSDSVFVNASTWALMLTGRIVGPGEATGGKSWQAGLKRLIGKSGEPVIRTSVTRAMRILGKQFVMGRTIGEALDRARAAEKNGYRHSYDMLGEAARTMADADRYFDAYVQAIKAIGAAAAGRGAIEAPGISVKLSALHPRYEFAQADRVMAELVPRLRKLCLLAAEADIGLCVDAEEADRLDLSMDVIAAISADPVLKGWDGFGLAVQAYQKRALPLIDWLAERARADGRRLMVRLVKGAYWDTEVKLAQVSGVEGYPVFTRKVSTDVSYLACARRLLAAPDAFYPAFATHNAHTVAAVMAFAGDNRQFEFQRLHGMGEPLHDRVVSRDGLGQPCRIYAPVGSHEELLAYLVRRLLENGANTSFVNRISDDTLPVDAIVADPTVEAAQLKAKPHPKIPLPPDLYGEARRNSRGVDVNDPATLAPLETAMSKAAGRKWKAGKAGKERPVADPSDRRRIVGAVAEASAEDAGRAVGAALAAQPGWDATPAASRAEMLERAADLYETHMADLMALAVREAGKTIPDAVAEVREAVDFLRYYATMARRDFSEPETLPGPTGERNQLSLHGRGVFVCISPWNFPLAIFTGQVSAALAAGNAVIAKPAEQTPLIAAEAVRLLHEAGIPADVLHLLPGDGATVGAALTADPRIGGVAFTGSTETAHAIHRTLAEKKGPIVPLIAETGGQNAMIVDSSALPEQVVRDVLASGFQSAGQRCSALRVLFVQEDVADGLEKMLAGAMAELRMGDPGLLKTDIGPVIDDDALKMLRDHAARMEKEGRLIARTKLPEGLENGTFFAPVAYAIDGLDVLEREVFGPILHVVRYKGDRLDAVIDSINATGYGLTLGIHSRIDGTIRHVLDRARVGNIYVNRNQIGAIVGVQPFGGEGLSGTGPKAGGPHYLHRFATERSLSIDTTAAGGNAALMVMEDGA